MAFSGLFSLLDDIAALMDDIAVLAKKAAARNAGIVIDDTAVNAKEVVGLEASRELPVIWEVAKGSAKNKVILIPGAMVLGAFAAPVIPWLLMGGMTFLCYEGVEKILHARAHKDSHEEHKQHVIETSKIPDKKEAAKNLVELEKEKIKGAIRTDMILSAEIIALTLSMVAGAPLGVQAAVLGSIGALMTVGVYGVVAALVKVDDGARRLQEKGESTGNKALEMAGRGLLRFAPWLMKGLSVGGTLALFMVGGEILAHGIPVLHDAIHHAAHGAAHLPWIGHTLEGALPLIANMVVGFAAGAASVAGVTGAGKAYNAVAQRLGFKKSLTKR